MIQETFLEEMDLCTAKTFTNEGERFVVPFLLGVMQIAFYERQWTQEIAYTL